MGALIVVLAGCPGDDTNGGPESPTATPGAKLAVSLSDTLHRSRRDLRLPGAAAAVVVDGKLVWSDATGSANLATGEPVTPATQFAVGSVIKPFVAGLALKLAERGDLALTRPLDRAIHPGIGSRSVSLVELLNHTAAFPNFTDCEAFRRARDDFSRQLLRDPHARWTPQRTLRYTRGCSDQPAGTPAYSNTHYIVAGLVIRRAAGSSVGRALHRVLLGSRLAGGLALQPEQRPHGPVAVGHKPKKGGHLVPLPATDYVPTAAEGRIAWTAGGLVGSATDVARAGDALLSGRLLEPASMAMMTRFTSAGDKEYGLGIERRTADGRELWGKQGDIAGFQADLWHMPDRRATVVAVTNVYRGVHDFRLVDALVEVVACSRRMDGPASTGRCENYNQEDRHDE